MPIASSSSSESSFNSTADLPALFWVTAGRAWQSPNKRSGGTQRGHQWEMRYVVARGNWQDGCCFCLVLVVAVHKKKHRSGLRSQLRERAVKSEAANVNSQCDPCEW